MANPAVPEATFTYHPILSEFTVSPKTYLASHPDSPFDFLATGTLVFDTSNKSTPLILLLQRSASDSMPNRWEIPGGGCDDSDESILHAAARELKEEAGLDATCFKQVVGSAHEFSSRSGKKICKFNFWVETKGLDVKLDAKEHQRYVWASEEQVKAKKAGYVEHVELEFTTQDLEDTVLKSFGLVTLMRSRASGE
ncbi:hypothetical protein EJ04DRAFT_514289 [Polyplosphaeria fusca]|uniref:Nudix hydrolase domain-containing protein n=1 Tax=Polyplosphaeria fusca TaxID=682080 RepID=A0A9P4QST8_9PLEO|nr:hypothetical protein EJ04DRAFT_514289 [Polyplosphaeria fusca]